MNSTPLPIVDEEPLPALYGRWLRELLGGPIPRESRATCNACAMVPRRTKQPPDAPPQWFDASVKCCSFLPDLPNFLVGAVLLSEPEGIGRRSILERIDGVAGVTPLGLSPNAIYDLVYRAGSAAFGRSPTLRCPHYNDADGGTCGIWKYRNSVCATWFCKTTRGVVSTTFWEAARLLLGSVEKELAVWCCLETGFPARTLADILLHKTRAIEFRLSEEIVAQRRDDQHRRLWGEWLHREVEFYQRCGELANSLRWDKVSQLVGQETRARAAALCDAYAALINPTVPDRLRLQAVLATRIDEKHVRVATPNKHDPIVVSVLIWEHLHAFDGGTLEEVLSRVPGHARSLIGNHDLLQRLVDYRVLAPLDVPEMRIARVDQSPRATELRGEYGPPAVSEKALPTEVL